MFLYKKRTVCIFNYQVKKVNSQKNLQKNFFVHSEPNRSKYQKYLAANIDEKKFSLILNQLQPNHKIIFMMNTFLKINFFKYELF